MYINISLQIEQKLHPSKSVLFSLNLIWFFIFFIKSPISNFISNSSTVTANLRIILTNLLIHLDPSKPQLQCLLTVRSISVPDLKERQRGPTFLKVHIPSESVNRRKLFAKVVFDASQSVFKRYDWLSR